MLVFFDLWHLHWAPIGVGIENGREINTGKLSAYLSPWKSLNISGLRLRAAHNSFSVSPDAAVLVFMPMYPWVKTPMSHRRHPFQSGDACRATLAYITHKSDSKATKSNMCPLSWVFAFWLGREEGRLVPRENGETKTKTYLQVENVNKRAARQIATLSAYTLSWVESESHSKSSHYLSELKIACDNRTTANLYLYLWDCCLSRALSLALPLLPHHSDSYCVVSASHPHSPGPRESCGAYENRSAGIFHAVLCGFMDFSDFRLFFIAFALVKEIFWDVWNSVTANGSVELLKKSRCKLALLKRN